MALSAERSVRVVPQPEQGIQMLTWPLREGEYAWQVRPAGPFAASPRSGTWSVRAIHTPFGSARVFRFGISSLHTHAGRGCLLSCLTLNACTDRLG